MKNSDMSREWELDGKAHRTKDDARMQVYQALIGSLVAATDEYLIALRNEVSEWLGAINREIDQRSLNASRQ